MDTSSVEQLAVPLPVGTVMFLLTDVEGSTFLWESAPDAMGAAIHRHYQLLDAAIALHGGMRPQEQVAHRASAAAWCRLPPDQYLMVCAGRSRWAAVANIVAGW